MQSTLTFAGYLPGAAAPGTVLGLLLVIRLSKICLLYTSDAADE